MNAQTIIAIELLAEADELLRPVRNWASNGHVVARLERREDFRRRGLPFRSGGDAATRKQGERSADQLERSGLVTFHRHAGKRTHARPTDVGDQTLRSLCGLPGLSEMMVALLALRAHEDRPHEPEDNVVPETWLAGLNGWGSRDGGLLLVTVEECLAPALVRGWVAAWSDQEGRVAYRLTHNGRHALDRGVRQFPETSLPEFSPEGADIYNAARLTARAELATAQPSLTNCSAIPLGCGDWPPDEDRAPIPTVVARSGEIRSLKAMLRAVRKATNTETTAKAPRRRKK